MRLSGCHRPPSDKLAYPTVAAAGLPSACQQAPRCAFGCCLQTCRAVRSALVGARMSTAVVFYMAPSSTLSLLLLCPMWRRPYPKPTAVASCVAPTCGRPAAEPRQLRALRAGQRGHRPPGRAGARRGRRRARRRRRAAAVRRQDHRRRVRGCACRVGTTIQVIAWQGTSNVRRQDGRRRVWGFACRASKDGRLVAGRGAAAKECQPRRLRVQAGAATCMSVAVSCWAALLLLAEQPPHGALYCTLSACWWAGCFSHRSVCWVACSGMRTALAAACSQWPCSPSQAGRAQRRSGCPWPVRS